MPVFVWEGRDRVGHAQKGELEAENQAALRVHLRSKRITVTKIKEKQKSIFSGQIGGARRQRITPKDVVLFTRQFATMIDAGLPLVQGLEILASQQVNRSFKTVLTNVKETVESGSTFADALKRHPKVFDELYVNLVAAGEIAGILDTILNRLSIHMEKIQALKKKVKGAMVYPIIVLVVAVVVVAILLVFVIPIFANMFAEFGKELPAFTQMVIDMSDWLRKWILLMIVVSVTIGIAFRKYYQTPKGRAIIDDLLLKSPVIGDLIKKVSVARFTRTLGTLISSGVPILDGLDIVAGASGNNTIKNAITSTRKSIAEGKNIAEPLAETGVFPPMVVQMISVGESTGALDAMLEKIADFYDQEVDAAVDALTAMLEPMLMVVLGGVIGGLVIAMYLPIFTMAAAIE
ncbi:MAG TPA: type II secretion system F family protein [Thermodesulfobacteriota bacterium]|mgnify:CR=1 FL=1|nr:type II secretion system F family protein [Deltaproteobacteria bacterium]HNU70938.1 type II secretion system F family protein [Thermodesulfobacteriota bacterium]HOC38838.1 type II secretion system F family protein [Thermodesulfobacteriota bacterium]